MTTPNRSWYTIAGIVCISFLVGGATSAVIFWSIFGAEEDNSTQLSQTQEEAQVALTTNDPRPDNERTSVPGFNSGSLDSIVQLSNEFERNLALYQQLSILDRDQLVEWVDESMQLEPDTRQDIQVAILQRLALLDPKLAFTQAEDLHASLMEVVFAQWSVTDLSEAVTQAKTLDGVRKRAALRAILKSRKDLPEDIRLQIGKQLDSEAEAHRMINASKADEYLENPEESWHEIVDKVQHDASQTGLLLELAQAWFEEEGLSVIDEINESLTNDQTRTATLENVLDMATKNNPRGTFELLVSRDSEIEDKFIERVTQNWANQELNSALNAVDVLESEALREQLFTSVMQMWADRDPYALLGDLEGLSEHGRSIGQEFAIRAIAKESPQEAAPLIEQMEDGSRKRNAAYAVASSWMRVEPRAALDWVLTDTRISSYRQGLLSFVLPTIAIDNPNLAFDTALSQPIGEGETSLESDVIAYVAQNDLDMAVELLPQVREEGNSRMIAYLGVSNVMVFKGKPMEAVELSQELPESDREAYFLLTMGTWSENDPEGLFNTIDKLPSAVAKSKAAAMLTLSNQFEKKLTDEQLEQAGKFLSEEDAKSLEEGGMGLLNPLMKYGLQ